MATRKKTQRVRSTSRAKKATSTAPRGLVRHHGIAYRSIVHDYYKYQLAESYELPIAFYPDSEVVSNAGYIRVTELGELVIRAGYAWDGPSGPTIDTPDFMRGSLVHDALYQLMRQRKIGQGWRPYADQLLHDLCVEDGMDGLRADIVHAAVRHFGASSARPTRPASDVPPVMATG